MILEGAALDDGECRTAGGYEMDEVVGRIDVVLLFEAPRLTGKGAMMWGEREQDHNLAGRRGPRSYVMGA